MPVCAHASEITVTELPEACDGCEDCLHAGEAAWCHLRICLTCGHVGCCDSSPGKHATAHAAATGHPLVRSLEPGEEWSWCYVDETIMRLDTVQGETRIPRSPLCG